MTDNRTIELLPCPFCGGDAVLFTRDSAYWVQCITKGDEPMGGCLNGTAVYKRHSEIPALDYDPREKAIEAWNTRQVETCHSIDPVDSGEFFICSNCNFGAGRVEFIPNYCPSCGRKVVDA